ncbi:beta-ketoacyl-[acyl-carrier-protein] synthase family protein [Streptomyces fulvorobeus]|uniref:3-oxoacyl-ACP synthase n=1 Tax=Streptomyces fulvorobeus TaxID=284028 RepID=A0A7J0C4C0_9ACTN|nr:beta-ketoacyl-[acyl-carrier-protein] synthase family protein [Streptomyces fulvorobeus]NYE40638.1 3-oxoacyl-[acyl-carrier-protein] synthase II [Streptomyces fulvorobeus]GFM96937.1 3-oxoacyl-ACP synthase [Streptomyces fulvorobeus]
MTHSPCHVAITGLGATTPLGGDVPTTWQSLLAGKTGVCRFDLSAQCGHPLPVRIAAPAAVDPATQLSAAQVRHTDRNAQLALIAAREAWHDAGYHTPATSDDSAVTATRVAAVIGVAVGSYLSNFHQYDLLLREGPSRVDPRCIPMILPNRAAAQVGLLIGARASVHVPVSACASGAEALALALRLIRDGQATVAMAGGTDAALHPLIVAGFSRMRALSRRNDEPHRASRPFDATRDGFVLGEGAAMLVLENADFARRRGARIYGYLAGAGMSNDSHHVAQPSPDSAGTVQAITGALADAGIEASRIRHINAHATSTPVGDLAEARALRTALASATDNAVVSATKAAFGHTLGAAGALEALTTVLALAHRIAPPTCTLEETGEGIDLDIVGAQPRELPAGDIAALSTSLGFGGHNVALVLRGPS